MQKKILDKVELFNVGQLREHTMGWLLSRYPEQICAGMSPLGAYVGTHACGCEIRFVKENPEDIVNVTLLCLNTPGNVTIMQGDYWVDMIDFAPGEIKTITLQKSMLFLEKNDAFFADNSFDLNVTRLVLSISQFVLCDVMTSGNQIRCPNPKELPKYTCLAYGSSITQGAGDIATPLSYIAQAARMLDSQVLNKGLGGSCFMEHCTADWLAQIPYDYMIFEAGANMYDDYTPEQIVERGTYLLRQVLKTHPEQYIFMPEPPMYFRQKQRLEKYQRFLDAVRQIQQHVGSDRCVLIPNDKVQKASFYVSDDLIHPSPFGHILMGANLAAEIKPYLCGEEL